MAGMINVVGIIANAFAILRVAFIFTDSYPEIIPSKNAARPEFRPFLEIGNTALPKKRHVSANVNAKKVKQKFRPRAPIRKNRRAV